LLKPIWQGFVQFSEYVRLLTFPRQGRPYGVRPENDL